MEANVLPTLNAVLLALRGLAGQATPGALGLSSGGQDTDLEAGDHPLYRHTLRLPGPGPARRHVRIMVTMPSAAADDREYRQVLERLEALQNMSHEGKRWDNAAMQSFFATLKMELILH